MGVRIPAKQSLFHGRTIVWFSCGIASAVCAKLVTAVNPDAEVAYCDTSRDEHPDNMRFKADVERWIGKPITVIRSDKYSSIDEVFAATNFMSGIGGARCTTELKKIPRLRFENPGDIHVFGFTADEQKRIVNFEENNPELYLSWPLRDNGMTKSDCLDMVRRAGIEIPAMYKLGFKNNNCLGCVKASSPKYWNMIRANFPAAFEQRASRSREIGCRLVQYHGERIFLDGLPAETTEEVIEDLSCGPQCGLK